MSIRRGLLIILSSPSGAGKSTLSKRLLAWDPDIRFSVSATTRAPRAGEVHGREYYFHSREDFDDLVARDQMLEHATVFGNSYGSPRGPVEQAIDGGTDLLFDIDWQGGQQIRTSALGKHVLSIFILPPSMIELERRLISRDQDSAEVIASRMAQSLDEISHWPEYDYVLVNEDLEATEEKLRTIICAERLRLSQQPGIVELVRGLNTEFGDRT
ncbi:guanylate kinase [Pseudooceanicola algae]|uniref:Guanylate kinase n=1 Tax=Pseudooceanicola algae TaxID=1537215 RepID=A0A418SEJ7_9RHOB|nr:guanylate kinase [Pseudooceanicola algae]QPM89738.1 Guanylate kinase [Pseudooceanicola algae]